MTFAHLWEYMKHGAGRPPGTMWAMERSYFEWKYKYPNEDEDAYLRLTLQSRYPLNDSIPSVASKCRSLDDAIIEAVRLDFGDFVAQMFEPALRAFPLCVACGQYRALSTLDALCYGCRNFGNLTACNSCRLYWEKDAKFCQKCGALLTKDAGAGLRLGTDQASWEQFGPNENFAPRFDLTEEDLLGFATTFFLAGEWAGLVNSETQAADHVMSLVERVRQQKIEEGEVIKQVYFPLQMLLMARRHGDFETIQQEPAFSKQGQSNLQRLFNAVCLGGRAAFSAEWTNIFSHRDDFSDAKPGAISFAGGPGFSKGTAVLIKAAEPEATILAEYWYLAYTYGRMGKDWKLSVQALIKRDQKGKMYDVLKIELPNGSGVEIFFDISHLPY